MINFNIRPINLLVLVVGCFALRVKAEEPACNGGEYVSVSSGQRCPKGLGTSLFRTPNNEVHTFEECVAMCEEYDCGYFSFGDTGKWDGVCMGCTADASGNWLSHHAFDTYKKCDPVESPTPCPTDECGVCNGPGLITCCNGEQTCDVIDCTPPSRPVSVCIALDESGSICGTDEIGCPNFHVHTKGFARRLIQDLDAVAESLFAVVSFARESDLDIPLSSAEEALTTIDGLVYRDGFTNTQGGIEQCRVALGDALPGHERFIILITDGLPTVNSAGDKSHNCDSCIQEARNQAELAKDNGISFITVGIRTALFNPELLVELASPNMYFSVGDFIDLDDYTKQVGQRANICEGAGIANIPISSSPTESPDSCNEDECGVCNGPGMVTCCSGERTCDSITCTPPSRPASVCIAIDESGSICKEDTADCPNFHIHMKGFARRIIQQIDGVAESLFSVVSFARQSNLDIGLSSAEDALRTIDGIVYRDGFTNTQAAIEQCRGALGSALPDHERFLILITDGLPTVNKANERGHSCATCIEQARSEAEITKSDGISIITVGVRTGLFNPELLQELASPGMYFSVDDFVDLDDHMEEVKQKANICDGGAVALPTPCPTDECGVCNGPGMATCCDGERTCDPTTCRPPSKPVSMCIALDESGSICKYDDPGCPNFNVYMKGFAKNIISQLDAISESLFAVVSFARKSVLDIGLSSAQAASTTIDNIEYRDGFTNTQAAIEQCRIELANTLPGHEKFIVLLTDGLPTVNKANEKGHSCESCINQAMSEADIAKANGINIITVGVRTGLFNPEILTKLASPGMYFSVDNFVDLDNHMEEVKQTANTCDSAVTTTFSPTTVAPTRAAPTTAAPTTLSPTTVAPTSPAPTKSPTDCEIDECGVSCGPGKLTCCTGYQTCKGEECNPYTQPISACIALDESGSICGPNDAGCPNFYVHTKGFAKKFIQLMDGISNSKFAVVSFARESNLDIELSDAGHAIETIDNLVYRDGYTNTQAAIEQCRTELGNAQVDHLKYIVLITDGLPTVNSTGAKSHHCDTCEQEAIDQAQFAMDDDISIITVGIKTNLFDATNLQRLASPGMYFSVDDFDILNDHMEEIHPQANICGNPDTSKIITTFSPTKSPTSAPTTAEPTPSPPPTIEPTTLEPTITCSVEFNCCDGSTECDANSCSESRPVSACIALDEGGSVCQDGVEGCPNFNVHLKGFASKFIQLMDGVTSGSKFAVVSFARKSTVDQPLSDARSALQAINNLEFKGGYTNTQAAIEQCRLELQNAPVDHQKKIVLVTDGRPSVDKSNQKGGNCQTCIDEARTEATYAKNAGISLITVGVQDWTFDHAILEQISSPGMYFSTGDFDTLDDRMGGVIQLVNICTDALPTEPDSFTYSPTPKPTTLAPSMSPTPCQIDVCGVECGPGQLICCDGERRCDAGGCTSLSTPISACIALDESGSVCKGNGPHCPNFNVHIKGFAKNFIRYMDGVTMGSEYAIVSFAGISELDKELSDAGPAIEAIDDLVYRDGYTNTQAAIEQCRIELTNAAPGNLKYIVLLTDGLPTVNKARQKGKACGDTCTTETVDEANIAKSADHNISIITIGIETYGFNPDLLRDVATNDDMFFLVNDFDELDSHMESINAQASFCQA